MVEVSTCEEVVHNTQIRGRKGNFLSYAKCSLFWYHVVKKNIYKRYKLVPVYKQMEGSKLLVKLNPLATRS